MKSVYIIFIIIVSKNGVLNYQGCKETFPSPSIWISGLFVDHVTGSFDETEPKLVCPLFIVDLRFSVIIGGVVSTTLTVLVAVPVFPAASVAL